VRTILVIDGAENCAYDCFSASDDLFRAIFPGEGQDVEFFEDFQARHPEGDQDEEFRMMWQRPVARKAIRGIDGLLFYDLEHKKRFYPNRRESDLSLPVSPDVFENL
jgi:hypothetical protein